MRHKVRGSLERLVLSVRPAAERDAQRAKPAGRVSEEQGQLLLGTSTGFLELHPANLRQNAKLTTASQSFCRPANWWSVSRSLRRPAPPQTGHVLQREAFSCPEVAKIEL